MGSPPGQEFREQLRRLQQQEEARRLDLQQQEARQVEAQQEATQKERQSAERELLQWREEEPYTGTDRRRSFRSAVASRDLDRLERLLGFRWDWEDPWSMEEFEVAAELRVRLRQARDLGCGHGWRVEFGAV